MYRCPVCDKPNWPFPSCNCHEWKIFTEEPKKFIGSGEDCLEELYAKPITN